MAAKEIVNSHLTLNYFEPVVNRWLVDYYFFLALELFQKEQYADFCGVTYVLERVLARPMEGTDTNPTKILVLQFLCRIHAGDSPDMSFESDGSISPLESALVLLEKNYQKFSIPPQDFKNVCTSLKEMIVGIFIKNNEFDKAEEVLNKHFPKLVFGKKAIFMDLIRQKSNSHEVIEQIDFRRFKEKMLAFCQRLFPFSVPFLHKAAKRLADERRAQPDDKAAAAGPDEQDEPGPAISARRNSLQFAQFKHKAIDLTRLELTYGVLATGSGERTFAQLKEEEQARRKDFPLCHSPTPKKGNKRDSEQDGLFQRDSGSPMEASPADQPQTRAAPQTQAGSLSKTPSVLRKRRLYTVAQLVVEPDSQGSSQCTTASQELEVEVRTEEPPQSPATINNNNKDLQNPVADRECTIHPRRNNKICSRASTSWAELSADSEEEPSCSVANGETCDGKLNNQSNSSARRKSTKSKQSSSDSEEDQQESPASCQTPVRKPRKQLASDPLSKDPDNTGDICITDSSPDSSPELFPVRPVPQTSSTPHKGSAQDKGPFHSKWKWLYNNAKESKDTWSDEETFFTSRKKSEMHNESTISNSGHRKRKWTERETQKLKEGVEKFGEGNWSKIKAFYCFKDRTNVNLKDRWRTLKKSKVV